MSLEWIHIYIGGKENWIKIGLKTTKKIREYAKNTKILQNLEKHHDWGLCK